MPWLMRDDQVLAALEVAESFRDRSRGLLGRDHLDGALLLRPARQVHSFRMRFPIDVAFCDGDLVVTETLCLRPFRVTRPRRGVCCILEVPAGAFERWRLRPGDKLEIAGE